MKHFESQKKTILNLLKKSQPDYTPTLLDLIDLYKKKMAKKGNKETIDYGTRNFMLPSYHKKTHFKGATSL